MRHQKKKKKKVNIQIYACFLCLQTTGNNNASEMQYLEDGIALKMQHFRRMYLLGRSQREISYHNEGVKIWEPQQEYSRSDPHCTEL